MNRTALDELKQQIPLPDYLQAHHWQQARPIVRPTIYADARKWENYAALG